MASLLFSSAVNDAIDKATSEKLPGEDLELNLDIADKIRSKEFPAKEAVKHLKKKIDDKNPVVQLLAIKLTDSCFKNAGQSFLLEMSSRKFMDTIASLLRTPIGLNNDVRKQLLNYIQVWGLASQSRVELSYITGTYEALKREGFQFPPPSKVDATLLEVRTAPEWTDSDFCTRCRTDFTTFNRKHHCRNCGQTFCQSCASKSIPLPHFGISQAVRVCDNCFSNPSAPPKLSFYQSENTQQSPSNQQEQDDIQRAIALSLQTAPQKTYSPPKTNQQEEDADLKAAIEASLKESEAAQFRRVESYPVAPAPQPIIAPLSRPKIEVSSMEVENISLFAKLVARLEHDVASQGPRVLQESNIQALYAQLAPLQTKIGQQLHESNKQYGAFLELYELMSQGSKAYDEMLQARLRGPTGYGQHFAAAYGHTGQSFAPPNVQNYPTHQPSFAPQIMSSPGPVQPYMPPSQPSAPNLVHSQPSAPHGYQPTAPPQGHYQPTAPPQGQQHAPQTHPSGQTFEHTQPLAPPQGHYQPTAPPQGQPHAPQTHPSGQIFEHTQPLAPPQGHYQPTAPSQGQPHVSYPHPSGQTLTHQGHPPASQVIAPSAPTALQQQFATHPVYAQYHEPPMLAINNPSAPPPETQTARPAIQEEKPLIDL